MIRYRSPQTLRSLRFLDWHKTICRSSRQWAMHRISTSWLQGSVNLDLECGLYVTCRQRYITASVSRLVRFVRSQIHLTFYNLRFRRPQFTLIDPKRLSHLAKPRFKHRILLIGLSVSGHETPKVVSAYFHPDSKTDCALMVFSFKPLTRKHERLC